MSCPGDDLYGSYVVTFDSAVFDGRLSPVYRSPRPLPAYQTWSASAPLAANGVLGGDVDSSESATMSVCGVRHDGGRECYDSTEGGSRIVPEASDLEATAYAS